jgi:DNA adenine methylase
LCFNGLYRVNRSGEFNVPYGKLKKPVVCNNELLKSCSASLKNIEITNVDFELSVAGAKEGDLVYFDPPYVALSKTASFASYQSNGFSDDEHRRLAKLIDSLTEKKVHVILSNSDTMLTQSLFRNMNLFSVKANRSISAAAESRNSVSELLGTNFELRNKSDLLTVISK